MDVARKNPKMSGVNGLRDLLSTVPIAPGFSHGFGDLLGRNEVLFHEREFFSRVVGEKVIDRFLDLLLLQTKGRGTVPLWI